MRKLLFSLVLLSMSASFTAAQAAVNDAAYAKQLLSQKTQLRPQHFNFFSDRYRQVTAQKSTTKKRSYKEQLDSQKSLLRHQSLDPASDWFVQLSAR